MAEETTSAVADFQKQMKRLKLFGLVLVLAVLTPVGYFCYRMFLDPSGKVAWSWQDEAATQLLVVQEGNVVVRVGDSIRVVDPDNGREVRRINNPLVENGAVTFLADGFLVTTPLGLAKVGTDGETVFDLTLGADPYESNDELTALRTLERELTPAEKKRAVEIYTQQAMRPYMTEMAVATDNSAAYVILTMPTDPRELSARSSTVVCIDLKTGTERWRSPKPFPADIAIDTVVATGTTVAMTMSKYDNETRESQVKFVAFSAAAGKVTAKIDLEAEPEWDPVAVDDSFVVNYAPFKVAVLASDFTQRFAIDLPQNDDDIDMVAKDGHLVMCYPAATIAYDLASGKGAWSIPVEIGDEEDIIFTRDHVVILGSKSERSEGDITSMPGFNQHEDMVKDMGLDKATATKTVPVLVVLDRKSGESLWSKDNVLGYMVASDTRLAVVMDTLYTSQFSMMKDGPGDLVVRQYDLDNGGRLYSRTTPATGIRGDLMIVDDRLVGIVYQPTSAEEEYANYGASTGKLSGIRLR